MANLKIKSSTLVENEKKTSVNRHHVNWHEAASCTIQIDLRDYSHMLEFLTEYPLGKKKKLPDRPTPD